MIYDSIKNARRYYALDDKLERALRILQENDLEVMPQGQRLIETPDMYLNIMEYAPRAMESAYPETHKKYADVAFIVKGRELVGYGQLEDMERVVEARPEDDMWFHSGSVSYHPVLEGEFTVVFPGEAHAPSIELEGCALVRKALVKVLWD